MARMKQFHDPELSIWQSAMDETIARQAAGANIQALGGPPVIGERPDLSDPRMREATAHCEAIDRGTPLSDIATGPVATEGLLQTLGYCSLTALKLAKAMLLGNQADIDQYAGDLKRFGGCDPLYAIAAAKYAEYFVAQGKEIPYRMYGQLGDFVIDGRLPARARLALVGDWGTGQPEAQAVLKQMAAKKPDVAIHLGDIYYAGTDFEISNYFWRYWNAILDLANRKIPTFTLSGNHDMYCGGVPYYRLLDQLGQPASYFCLRNDYWQFVGLDTGYNDHNPGGAGAGATWLRDSEVSWLHDKVANAGNRKTVLLSHHQLFTAFDSIDGHEVNLRLFPQVQDLLPKISLWFWGHEHNFAVYGPFQGLPRARLLGHGAFPVGLADVPAQPKFAGVPLVTDAKGNILKLDVSAAGDVYNHGYAIMELDGPDARVSYYQDSDEDHPMYEETL